MPLECERVEAWRNSVNLHLGQLTPEQSPAPDQSPTTSTKRKAAELEMEQSHHSPVSSQNVRRRASPSKRRRVQQDDYIGAVPRGRDTRAAEAIAAQGSRPLDAFSTSSSVADFLQNTPSLSEVDRSTSQQSPSRASSPSKQLQDRMKRAQLRITTPRFVMGTLLKQTIETIDGTFVTADLHVPNHIIEIIDALDLYTAASSCIPINIRDEITSTWPESVGSFSRSFFGDTSPQGPVVFEFVKGVYTEAAEAFREYKDESAWQPVAEKILQFGLPRLEVVMAQTKLVYSELLPTIPDINDDPVPISRVKVDLHIALKGIKELEDMIQRASRRSPTGSTSAFHSPEAESRILTALVEVKGMHGVHEEAIYQCSVASAALQKRLQQIEAEGDNEAAYRSSKPIINFIVLGHSWFSHIVFKQGDGSVVSGLRSSRRTKLTHAARFGTVSHWRNVHATGHFRSPWCATKISGLGKTEILAVSEGDLLLTPPRDYLLRLLAGSTVCK
jgi:hypothetical protein